MSMAEDGACPGWPARPAGHDSSEHVESCWLQAKIGVASCSRMWSGSPTAACVRRAHEPADAGDHDQEADSARYPPGKLFPSLAQFKSQMMSVAAAITA
jgi:hypothetical protein